MIMIVLSLNIPNVDKISYKMTEYEAGPYSLKNI